MSNGKPIKRILIDGRFIGVGDSIARYTLEILRGILELDKTNEYTLLIRPCGVSQAIDHLSLPITQLITHYPLPITHLNEEMKNGKLMSNEKWKMKNLSIIILDIPHYSIKEQIALLSYLNKEKFDLVHFTQFNHPIFYRGKFIVTIHDLILQKMAGNPLKKFVHELVMKHAVKASEAIISISETTKKDILSGYKIKPDKITTIYHGIDHEKFNSELKTHKSKIQVVTDKYKIRENFLLYVGAWKKHKNLKRLLLAFEKILATSSSVLDTGLQLVLVGKIDYDEPEIVEKIESINNSALSSKFSAPIVTTGPVDINSDELPALYAGATAYVIPSLLEGFGWPPLEAMACGTPVVASDTSCIPEILGDAPIYFNPLSTEDITNKIGKVLNDENLQRDMSKKGIAQAEKYQWSTCARETYEIYKKGLDRTSGI